MCEEMLKEKQQMQNEKSKINKRKEEVNRMMDELQLQRKPGSMDRTSSVDSQVDSQVDGQLERPPRLKYFNVRKYFHSLFSTGVSTKAKSTKASRPKVENANPLPNRMDNIRSMRRIPSSPAASGGVSMEKHAAEHGLSPAFITTPKWIKTHKRRSSDEV